jgi:hypothetical protein
MLSPAAAKPRRIRYAHGIALPRVADGRTRAAKRFRSLVNQFALELGNDLSAADQALIKQAAHLVLTSEQLQTASISGEPVSADELVRVNSEARRVLSMLRTKAEKAKPAGPTLAEYVAANYGSAAEADEDEPEGAEAP